MNIVYYAIAYHTFDNKSSGIGIGLRPYPTKEKAEEACLKLKKKHGNKIILTKVKRVDLSKSKDGFWL